MAEVIPAQAPPPRSGGMVATITGDVFEAFKTSPVLLLVVLLNMAFAGIGGYVFLQVRTQEHDERMMMLSRCLIDAQSTLRGAFAAPPHAIPPPQP